MRQGVVTVVVPVYNVEKYLDRCIQSIVDQTYRNLEILLVDDGSPDRCPQICDDWTAKDERIRVIHKKNAGLGMARNSGIEQASGEYICFFDSDDYVDTHTVEKAYTLAKRENAELVLFGSNDVDEDGNLIRSFVPVGEKRKFVGRGEVCGELLPDLIEGHRREARIKNLLMSACSCLFSMSLIEKINWRFVSERQNISEDSYSLLELYAHVQCAAVLGETLYFYRNNEKSLTRTYRADRYEKCCRFYHDSIALAQAQGFDDLICTRIAGLFFSFSMAAMKQIAASDMQESEKKKLIKQIVQDKTMRLALKKISCSYESSAKNIFCRMMKCRMWFGVWILLKMKTSGR